MVITEVSVLPVENDEKLKAFVTVKLYDCMIIKDIKIIKGVNNFFVAMPAKKMKDGTYRDLIHPLDKSTRSMMEKIVMDEYQRVSMN